MLPGTTGTRYFYLDDAGVIRQSSTYTVGPRSEALDRDTQDEEERDPR